MAWLLILGVVVLLAALVSVGVTFLGDPHDYE